MKSVEELIREMPADLRQEVEDFVHFIMQKRRPKPRSKPSLSWRGALADLKDQYSSVELQHEILKHWGS
jgi:hypothetical protein